MDQQSIMCDSQSSSLEIQKSIDQIVSLGNNTNQTENISTYPIHELKGNIDSQIRTETTQNPEEKKDQTEKKFKCQVCSKIFLTNIFQGGGDTTLPPMIDGVKQ